MINIENKNIFSKAKVAIIGASGGIGSTISKQVRALDRENIIIEIVRQKSKKSQFEMDMLDEHSVAKCAEEIRNKYGSLDHFFCRSVSRPTDKHISHLQVTPQQRS